MGVARAAIECVPACSYCRGITIAITLFARERTRLMREGAMATLPSHAPAGQLDRTSLHFLTRHPMSHCRPHTRGSYCSLLPLDCCVANGSQSPINAMGPPKYPPLGNHPIHVHPVRPLYRFAATALGASMWFFVRESADWIWACG